MRLSYEQRLVLSACLIGLALVSFLVAVAVILFGSQSSPLVYALPLSSVSLLAAIVAQPA